MAHFQFGEFVADESKFELRQGGRVIRIQRIVLETIFHLLRSRDRVVTKRDFEQGPWQGQRISRAVVSRVIMLARRAIGDESASTIVTVRGRGYRFVAEVKELAESSEVRGLLAAIGLEIASPTVESLGFARDWLTTVRSDILPWLETLTRAFERARRGRGDVVVIAHEDRVRTEILEHFCHYTEGMEVFVTWGRCWEANSAPAFWPWLEVVRSCVTLSETPHRQQPSLRNDADLLALLSHLGYLSDGCEYSDSSPVSEEFWIFDAVTRLLIELAKIRPLVVILDDWQEADGSSLRLLEFFRQRLRRAAVLVIVTQNEPRFAQSSLRARDPGDARLQSEPQEPALIALV